MAIIKDQELSSEAESVFRFSNGDLEALKNLQSIWDLKNEEATVTFAIGVLRLAENTKRILVETNGAEKPVPITPGKKLLKENNAPIS